MHITIRTPQGFELAKATQSDLDSVKVIQVEGNWYFDPALVDMKNLRKVGEGKNYFCHIKKGYCDYYDFEYQGEKISELAWIYPKVENSLFKSIDGKVAFWRGKFVLEQK